MIGMKMCNNCIHSKVCLFKDQYTKVKNAIYDAVQEFLDEEKFLGFLTIQDPICNFHTEEKITQRMVMPLSNGRHPFGDCGIKNPEEVLSDQKSFDSNTIEQEVTK